MARTIKIKKGLDIPLAGRAEDTPVADTRSEWYAIMPDDFPGYTWKAAVKAGDSVKAGSALFSAKEDPEMCLTSPCAGTVSEIHRGERRKIQFISVHREGKQEAVSFKCDAKPESIIYALKQSGLFAMMRQRPFDIVPISMTPRDIFVTAFDTAPLAPEFNYGLIGKYLEAGVEALAKLTSGKVYLSVRAGSGLNSKAAETVEFEGPHPAGNVGVQIEAINPVNKGETVWTLNAMTAARIGRLVIEGVADYSARVALTGPDVTNPGFVDTLIGVSLKSLLEGRLRNDGTHLRIISGNVLTGWRVNPQEGWLRYPYRQISVIDEGDQADEFMGWASMNPGKYSVKKTFPAFLRGLKKPFNFDARIKGGHRAMILSGEYDKVFPFDIYPEYLIKAIMAKDIEKMEQLGIYEVAPEDFALPEFVDTSKIELQKIVREGLDYLRKETM